MKYLRAFALIALAMTMTGGSAQAAPPWDLTVNVTPPTACADGDTNLTACPVTAYQLYIDGALEGPVVAGANTFPSRITTAGAHTFRVDTVGPGGTTAGDTLTRTVSELKPGGKVTITIQIDCGTCVISE